MKIQLVTATRTMKILALGVALALAACAGSPEAAAERTARQWLDALNAGNLAAAQELSTDATKGLLQMSSSMGQSMAVGKYKITNVTVMNENSAQVTAEVEKESNDMTLQLVRIDGRWKVGIKK